MTRAWPVPLVLLAALLAPSSARPDAAVGRAEPEPSSAGAAPLPVRNLSPLAQVLGLPHAQGERVAARLQSAITVEHSNNFTADEAGETAVVFDGSTTVTTLGLHGGFGERWEWAIEIPYVHHGGGFTDGFIEDYHDLFGFPDGDRDEAPRDRIDYRMAAAGHAYLNVTDRESGIGDLRLQLGHVLHQTTGRQLLARAMIELPTGDEETLTGSGSTDASFWLELVEARWLARWNATVTAAGGVTFIGDELVPDQRSAVGTAHLGVHVPVGRRVTLRGQLDGHSELVQSDLEPFRGAALLGTLGATIALSSAVQLDLGLVEDLTPERAPDVVFLIGLRVPFR
ncbi:MAG TPA: DUF3187 family protein [Pseudomonadales bacterium]